MTGLGSPGFFHSPDSRYGAANFIHRKPLSQPVRTVLTRTFLGLGTLAVPKPAVRRR